MAVVSGRHAWLAACALACAAHVSSASPLQLIAHSAQLTLEGSTSPAGLTLQLRPADAATPLTVTEVSVAVAGVTERAVRQADGSWLAPLPSARVPSGGKVDVFVVHDGIREVLSGPLPATASGTPVAGGASRPSGRSGAGGKQLAWWVLNIAIVLIAVLAISRRMS
jgi:hypothetical protein